MWHYQVLLQGGPRFFLTVQPGGLHIECKNTYDFGILLVKSKVLQNVDFGVLQRPFDKSGKGKFLHASNAPQTRNKLVQVWVLVQDLFGQIVNGLGW